MKFLRKIRTSKTAVLNGPLFIQNELRRNDRRNAQLVFWYRIKNPVYLCAAFVVDSLFMIDGLYHDSVDESALGVLGALVTIAYVAIRDKVESN